MTESTMQRKIKIVHTEESINPDSFAKLLASVITEGDSNAYINRIISNRAKNKHNKGCEDA